MSADRNTQGTGSGAGTGTGSGGAGSGTGGGGAGTGPRKQQACSFSKPRKTSAEIAALVFCLACVVTGLALVITPLTSQYTNPDIRITAYLTAWVVLWAAATPVIGRVGRAA